MVVPPLLVYGGVKKFDRTKNKSDGCVAVRHTKTKQTTQKSLSAHYLLLLMHDKCARVSLANGDADC